MCNGILDIVLYLFLLAIVLPVVNDNLTIITCLLLEKSTKRKKKLKTDSTSTTTEW